MAYSSWVLLCPPLIASSPGWLPSSTQTRGQYSVASIARSHGWLGLPFGHFQSEGGFLPFLPTWPSLMCWLRTAVLCFHCRTLCCSLVPCDSTSTLLRVSPTLRSGELWSMLISRLLWNHSLTLSTMSVAKMAKTWGEICSWQLLSTFGSLIFLHWSSFVKFFSSEIHLIAGSWSEMDTVIFIYYWSKPLASSESRHVTAPYKLSYYYYYYYY